MLDDPAMMSPSQRRREIAAILARGGWLEPQN